jgi:hypothetical protein
MRYLLLLFSVFFISHFAKAQGACFNCSATYSFTDASVPPEFHRSYTITVLSGYTKLFIHSYGDTLLFETYKTDHDFRQFLKDLKACKLAATTIEKPNNCTGGTTDFFYSTADTYETLVPYKKLKLNVHAKVYHCGGKSYGNIKGKIAEAKDLFKSMVPDFNAKMASTEK